jgi:dienelactone hydrolase
MYGEGKNTEHPQEAGKFAAEVRKNKQDWQARAQAALKVLASQEQVDPDKLAAIGYCFGGSTCLELAYSGADLKAVATFHAALPAPTDEEAKAIKARILINNGADDKFIPEKAISDFKTKLDAAKVKYQFENFPGAVHSFSEGRAGGEAEADRADRRSGDPRRLVLRPVPGPDPMAAADPAGLRVGDPGAAGFPLSPRRRRTGAPYSAHGSCRR